MTVKEWFEAAGKGPRGVAPIAYNGRGQVFSVGVDGSLRSLDVRSELLSSTRLAVAKETAGQVVRTLMPSPPLGFDPEQIRFSRGGQFAVLAGLRSDDSEVYCVSVVDTTDTVRNRGKIESVHAFSVGEDLFENRPGLRALQVSWHRDSDIHICILTSDNTWHLYNVQQPRYPEQTFELTGLQAAGSRGRLGLHHRELATAFAFGAPRGWGRFSVFFLTSKGSCYVMCPVVPFGARYPAGTLHRLFSSCQDLLLPEGAEGQTAEAWMQRAFPGAQFHHAEEAPHHRHAAVPHSLEDCSPALQGPLKATVDREAEPSDRFSAPSSSMLLLHWETASVMPDEEGGSSAGGCSAIVMAGPSGSVWTAVVAGDVAPAWEEAAPKQWLDDDGSVLATRSQADACSMPYLAPSLLLIDEIPVMDPEDPDSDEEDEINPPIRLLRDPVTSEHFYAVHNLGVVGISLPWLPLLGDFLSSASADDSQQLTLPQLPSPSALELSGDWGRSGLAGTCVAGDAVTGSHLVLVTASGEGTLLPTRELSCAGLSGGEEASPQPGIATSPAMVTGSFGSPVEHAVSAAASTFQEATKDAEAAIASQYSWLLSGPDSSVTVPRAPGSSCSEIDGQRHLHAAIAQLHKKYVEFATQSHQFISQKVASLHEEAERQTSQEAQMRALHSKVITDAKLLQDRVDRAAKFNKNLQSRLSLLTLLDDSQPRPLSDKEEAFGNEELPLRESQATELRRRLEMLSKRTSAAVEAFNPRMQQPSRGLSRQQSAMSMPQKQVRRMQEELVKINSVAAANQEVASQIESYLRKISFAL